MAASLLALVWVSLTSHRNFWEFVRATDQIYHTNRVLRAAQHLLNLEQEAEIGVRGFHITGQDRYLAPYRRVQRDMPAALDMLRELTAQDAAQRGRFETLEPLLNIRMEMREREIGVRRAGGIDLAEIALASGFESCSKRYNQRVCKKVNAMYSLKSNHGAVAAVEARIDAAHRGDRDKLR